MRAARSWYARMIHAWERSLAARDPDRRPYPFQLGLEWVPLRSAGQPPDRQLEEALQWALENSDEYYAVPRLPSFELRGRQLLFPSLLQSNWPENNTVWATYSPARRHRGRAVLILPQWNADSKSHHALARLLTWCGISALRLTLAFHGPRRPPGFRRADLHVSANLGLTAFAVRQSVIDARCAVAWLASQGYTRIGILGTSLGSCVAFLAAAHEPRLKAGAFNHVSHWFGDVVWTGLATRHVRVALENHVTPEQLRQYWAVISPAAFVHRFERRPFRSLFLWARFDPVFLPEYSQLFLAACRDHGLEFEAVALPCGHYTLGQPPFNLLDGLLISRFFLRAL